jgi:Ca2+-binding EF-hand superfamily protein
MAAAQMALPTVGEHDAYAASGADFMMAGAMAGGRLAPMGVGATEADPLRRRVESCLLRRERTVEQLLTWLRTAYTVQENVGAKYLGSHNIPPIRSLRSSASLGALRPSASSSSAGGGGLGQQQQQQQQSTTDLRNWRTLSSSTRDDHRMKTAILLAALRVHTCELVEALEEWRQSRPPLQVMAASGQEVTLPRPFVWRGRWWPLQLCLDPPLLPLPLPADPLMLRWFDEDAPLWAGGAPLPSPSQQSLAPSQDGGDGGGGGRTPMNAAAAPVSLFRPAAWHPPHILDRMEAAEALVLEELDILELRAPDLIRQRHAAPGSVGGGSSLGGGLGRDGSSSSLGGARSVVVASVPTPKRFAGLDGAAGSNASYASSWSTDGASLQLARMLYGGPKPYLAAMRTLCRRIEGEMAAEYARREQAASRIQAITRGRRERLHGPSVTAKQQEKRQPVNKGENRIALRKEAGGRFAGLTINYDPNSGKSLQEGLRDALTANASRVMDLFRDWDMDGNGLISKAEFRKAIRLLAGSAIPREEIDGLFDSFDKDKGGTIDARELGKILRRGAGDDIKLAEELEAGAMGEITLKAENKIKLRAHAKDGRSARAGIEPTIFNIKTAMAEDLMRVKDIMNVLDQDQDGGVTKAELCSILPILGFDKGGTDALEALFDDFDEDRSGVIDFAELNRLLRKEFEPEPLDSAPDPAPA